MRGIPIRWLRSRLLLACFVSLASLQCAHAGPVAHYQLELTIDSLTQHAACNASATGAYSFGCLGLGQVYQGTFSIDTDILASDGIHSNGSLIDFSLGFGNALYSTGASNLTLAGFRNPQLGAAAPGFVVASGELVDFFGGAYGFGDQPFIDMYGYAGVAANRFAAYDGISSAAGSLLIRRIPIAPTEQLLALLATIILALRLRSRRK